MSELEKAIRVEVSERTEINPFNGKEIKHIDYVGTLTIVKTGTFMIQDEDDAKMTPRAEKEMRRLIKRTIREKVTQLGFDDLKTNSTEFNRENNLYETPIIEPTDVFVHPAKMAELLKDRALVIPV